MIVFLLELWVLLTALARHIRRDVQFRALALLLVLLLAGGTLFYWQTEHWSLVDSLYFCVMTIATVGYGDVVPTKDVSKLFTIGYAVLGIGLFATFVGRLLMLTLQRHAATPPSPGEAEN
jgi:hypothetical protein